MKILIRLCPVFALIIVLLVTVSLYAMTVNDTKIAYQNGDTVYYAPQEVYDYFQWKRATLPGAPYNSNTRIPSGTISQMTNNPTVVEGELVDDWTASVNGTTMNLNKLYPTKAAFKTVLRDALQARIDETAAIIARDEAYILSIDEIGEPILSVSVTELDFGDTETVLSFNIDNIGEGKLDWLATSSNPKVSVPELGSVMEGIDILTVTVDRSGMPTGTYNPIISITSDGGNAQIELTVIVP